MTTVKTKVEIPRRGRGKGVYLSACVGVTPLKPRVESRVCAKEPQPGPETTADHNPHVPVWLGRADARPTRHRSTTHRIHNAQSTNVGQTQNVTHSVTHFFLNIGRAIRFVSRSGQHDAISSAHTLIIMNEHTPDIFWVASARDCLYPALPALPACKYPSNAPNLALRAKIRRDRSRGKSAHNVRSRRVVV
jgi:hypothetical protein